MYNTTPSPELGPLLSMLLVACLLGNLIGGFISFSLKRSILKRLFLSILLTNAVYVLFSQDYGNIRLDWGFLAISFCFFSVCVVIKLMLTTRSLRTQDITEK